MKDSTNVKLTGFQRFSYGIYDTGYYLVNYWVTSFLTLYYSTVVGVSLEAIGALIMFVRIFDAINDPIIGSMADRSKKGYKPWLVYGGIGTAVMTVLMFSPGLSWSLAIKTV